MAATGQPPRSFRFLSESRKPDVAMQSLKGKSMNRQIPRLCLVALALAAGCGRSVTRVVSGAPAPPPPVAAAPVAATTAPAVSYPVITVAPLPPAEIPAGDLYARQRKLAENPANVVTVGRGLADSWFVTAWTDGAVLCIGSWNGRTCLAPARLGPTDVSLLASGGFVPEAILIAGSEVQTATASTKSGWTTEVRFSQVGPVRVGAVSFPEAVLGQEIVLTAKSGSIRFPAYANRVTEGGEPVADPRKGGVAPNFAPEGLRPVA
jgi:hypothetical protein